MTRFDPRHDDPGLARFPGDPAPLDDSDPGTAAAPRGGVYRDLNRYSHDWNKRGYCVDCGLYRGDIGFLSAWELECKPFEAMSSD